MAPFAAKMPFKTVAIARGADKGSFAKNLGAQTYMDSTAQNAAEELTNQAPGDPRHRVRC